MYYIFRSTTDKVAEHMNHIEESGDTIIAPTFTGGRDWVIVCRKGQERRDLTPAEARVIRDQLQQDAAEQRRAIVRSAKR